MGFFRLYLYLLLISCVIIFHFVSAQNETRTTTGSNNQIVVDIGLILDLSSSSGFIANSCISMALSDFYSTNTHYTTRLALHLKNSNDIASAVSSALELINEEQVDAIIVPRNSNQARFVAKIGEKSQVPIISLSETSSLLWPSPTPYFIRTEPDSSELEGIASLVKVLGWHDLVVLYQDDTEEEFGSGFIPSLTHTFQQASIKLSYVRAISTSASVSRIKKELRHLRTLQTRVYLVHVTSHDLASRLFSLLHEAGMMSKGTAWIITDALSNSISSLDATTIESMEGVISIRPYIPKSKNLDNFKIKWNQNNCLQENDTVWPLATAVEKIQFQEVKESSKKLNALSPAITQSRISEKGPGLLDEILKTRSPGLSGQFKLKQGKLETRAFEIINILGNGYRTVGYWTPRRGFSRKIQSAAEEDHDVVVNPNNEENVLKPIIWPGETTQKPKGWDIPVMPLKLRGRH